MSSSLRVNTIVPSTGTNVAIGTANGTVTFTDSVNFVLGTGSSIFSPASNTLTFGTNDAERFRIDSNGKIGIGTDTISDNLEVFAPTNASLQIKGGAAGSDASRSAQLKLLASGSKLYVMEADATDGSFRILDSSTERLRITSDGKLTITTDTVSYTHLTLPTKQAV